MSSLNEWIKERRRIREHALTPDERADTEDAYPSLLTAVEKVLELHQPVPEAGLGYTESGYGEIDPACGACGTYDEYAMPWPCGTVRAIEGEINE